MRWPRTPDDWRLRLEQLTLQKRLIIAYVLIMLLPSVVISFYVFKSFTGNAIEDLKKNSHSSLEIEQAHVHNNVETMVRAAQIATNDKVRDYLRQSDDISVPDLIDIDNNRMRDIVGLQYNNPALDDIRIFMNNPKTYEIWPVFMYEKRIREEPWYAQVLEGEGETSVWMFSREKRELMQSRTEPQSDRVPRISLYRNIEYPKGTHVGIVQVDMKLAAFFPNTFSPLQDEASQMVVLDPVGGIYRYPGESFLDRAGLTEEALQPQLARILDRSGPSGSFEFAAGGSRYLAVYSLIDPLQAYMVKLVSLEHVYQDINRTRNLIVLANVILLSILALSTSFINSFILKKLHVLTDSVKKVRQGEFNFDVDIRGGGEVGELAHHFRKMLRKMGELIADAVNKQAAAKEAELATLKNQIDAHFLYNTLENIKMMAEVHDHREISDALTSLGGMMRYSMRWTSESVRLRDEVNHIHNYVNIANVRFEDRVTLVTDIPEELLDQELLKMSLQPVVENSIKHGLRDRPMTIVIRAEAAGGAMLITVADDGCGMDEDRTVELNRRIGREEGRLPAASDSGGMPGGGNGIGLANVHSRIQMNYGSEFGLKVESAEGRYTRVAIRVPYFITGGRLNGHEDDADRR